MITVFTQCYQDGLLKLGSFLQDRIEKLCKNKSWTNSESKEMQQMTLILTKILILLAHHQLTIMETMHSQTMVEILLILIVITIQVSK